MSSQQEIELELAWLIKSLPDDLTKSNHTEIYQAYLESTDPNIKDIRIREKEGKFTYTIKRFIKGFQETGYTKEETKELSKTEFEKLKKTANKKIRKIRYYYPLQNDLIAEVDIYKNNLEGLNVVEVEFPSLDSCKHFNIPDWFGKEVTDSNGIYPPFIADMTIDEVNLINEAYQQKPHKFE